MTNLMPPVQASVQGVAAWRLAAVPLLLALLAPGPGSAATRLEFRGTTRSYDAEGALKSEHEVAETLWIDGDRAVSETKGQTFVVDLAKQSALIVDHHQETYERASLPLVLEDYASSDQKAFLRQLEPFFAATTLAVNESRDVVSRGSWKAREVQVTATAVDASLRFELDVWLSTELDVAATTYDALARSRLALSPFVRVWAPRLIELEGMAVEQTTTMTAGGRRTVDEQKLIHVESDVEIPATKLQPPAGYREVPFDAARRLGFPRKTGGPG